MATADRRLDVLRAIVSDYVATREPVGSKMLVERYDLGVSPATIRNDMAALEEDGLIYQPHTSAGRIPTVKGYRLFVDRLAQLKPMSLPERRAMETFLSDAVDIDDVVERTVRLLAQLTRQVAIVQYPRFERTHIVRVELVDLGESRILVVVITDDGQVSQRVLAYHGASADDISYLRDQLNSVCVGTDIKSIPDLLTTLALIGDDLAQLRVGACQAVVDLTRRDGEDRILIAGTANLARSTIDFRRTIVPVLDALEEQVALLRLFSAVPTDDVTVSIGEENLHDGLAETSVVAGAYGDDNATAHLAVVGPMRMDYASAMSAVRAIGTYLSHFLQKHN
ncbi:MAG: heat-inducible transcriptional repressor HrcA [Actinomycetaceae bacterium]|nr:heat-inducible transcriptional repressor HrcA [Actinomycetaceae bacterium]